MISLVTRRLNSSSNFDKPQQEEKLEGDRWRVHARRRESSREDGPMIGGEIVPLHPDDDMGRMYIVDAEDALSS